MIILHQPVSVNRGYKIFDSFWYKIYTGSLFFFKWEKIWLNLLLFCNHWIFVEISAGGLINLTNLFALQGFSCLLHGLRVSSYWINACAFHFCCIRLSCMSFQEHELWVLAVCRTALFHVCMMDDSRAYEVVQYFLDLGADLERGELYSKRTCLMAACSTESQQIDIVRYLLEKGADILARDRKGWLCFACLARI